MREIKFRAKIVMDIEPFAMKKGYWVEGHYYEDLQDGEWCSWIAECDDIIHYKVDKNTLSQFTGLLDKDGKEIYEGDIVHLDTWKPHAMQIAFIEGAFCLADENGAFLGDIHYANHAGINQCTILGNVFDNPELLKGGAE